jgi:hypothetical protein
MSVPGATCPPVCTTPAHTLALPEVIGAPLEADPASSVENIATNSLFRGDAMYDLQRYGVNRDDACAAGAVLDARARCVDTITALSWTRSFKPL